MIYKGIDAMSKLHVKKGDTVYVNTGEDKGKTGRILEVLVKENRAVVEGINIVTKHTKPNAQNPQGGPCYERGFDPYF